MAFRLQRVALCFLALVLCRPLFAQESGGPGNEAKEAPDTEFTLSLARVNGQPGTEVSMPVLFARKTSAPNVTTLRVQLRYNGAVLKFARIEDAYLSRRVQMRLQAKETVNPASQSLLEMSFELPDPPRTSFPSGQLATIFFNIAAGAPDGAVPLAAEAWIDGKQVMPDSTTARVEPGQVTVSQTPVFVSCFFFTH